MPVAATTAASAASKPTPSNMPVLRRGAKGDDVRALQNRLKAAGFNPGPVDGVFGPGTELAVKRYQKAKGLIADGIVGAKTWGKLYGSSAHGTGCPDCKSLVGAGTAAAKGSGPTLKAGDKGAAVKTLQNRLNQLGFNAGAADGAFGPKTAAAVKAFQKAKGLAADGIVGPNTWAKLGVKAGGATPGAPAPSGGSGPLLKNGAKGEPVKKLQARLNQLGFNAGGADGSFGPKTLAAVKAFQKSRGLTADGVVGPNTWKKLGIHVKGLVSYPGGSPGSGGGTKVTGYVAGVPRQITLSSIPNGKKLRSDAANAYNKMYAAAKAAGVTLNPVSGFRTMAEQQYLYNLYKSGKGNLAAKPGYSNHQGGIAVDISVGSTASSTYKWLAANAHKYGFKRTVPSEPWHWEYRP